MIKYSCCCKYLFVKDKDNLNKAQKELKVFENQDRKFTKVRDIGYIINTLSETKLHADTAFTQ